MTVGRRTFLVRTAALAGGAAAGAAFPGCMPDVSPAPLVDVPAPVSGRISIEVAQYPDLSNPDGAIRAQSPGVGVPILVVRTPDGGFAALGSICTHLGCPLGFEPFEIVCPCHHSRFALDGHVTNPPARVGLPTFPTSYDAGSGVLTVEIGG
ncbi:MAG TPA: Rieske (2Fe-2S) protein [Anaeromyxobacteraceae bacterium]|nr:Rieske (2Fe-2S) protein [Anaeromyxobacteraceae bacterium]